MSHAFSTVLFGRENLVGKNQENEDIIGLGKVCHKSESVLTNFFLHSIIRINGYNTKIKIFSDRPSNDKDISNKIHFQSHFIMQSSLSKRSSL